jgi:hypothetical protein
MSKHIQERAQRLTHLLNITGLSRKVFAQKHNIAIGNFQNWEGPRFGGLTEKAALKIIAACRTEGVESNVEWLMYGSGTPPTILFTAHDKAQHNQHPHHPQPYSQTTPQTTLLDANGANDQLHQLLTGEESNARTNSEKHKEYTVGARDTQISSFDAQVQYLVPTHRIQPSPAASTITTTIAEEQLYRSKHYTELAKIARELDTFRSHYGYDVLTTTVSDDSMEPRYSKGDRVAGKRHLEVTPLCGHDCIVEIERNKLLVGIPEMCSDQCDSDAGLYNLTFHNSTATAKGAAPITAVAKTIPKYHKYHKIKIYSAAPISWVRRMVDDL